MKITIKTTQQKIFQVEIESTESIAALKAKIQEAQGHPAAVQKIIYSGQILTDDKTVESCGIKEKDFLVLMVSKPKPSPAASSAHVPPVAPATLSQNTPVTPQTVPTQDVTPVTTTPASAPALGDPSAFLSGENLQAAINNMVEMGFPREQVLRAMRASFNNADRAVEYLMTGIPSHLEADESRQGAAPVQATQPAPAAAPQAPAQQSSTQPQNLFQLAQQQQAAGSGGPAAGGGPGSATRNLNLEALRNSPQIQQLREQISQNPEMIQPLVQQLAAQNPQLAQMFAQSPEALLQLLGVELDEEGGELPHNAHVVSVTEEERAAIQRLEALGFPRQAVLEAYLACDKNEELAANYLFESGFDD